MKYIELITEIMQSLTLAHYAIGVSVLALLASLRSSSISKRSLKLSEDVQAETRKIKLYEKRTEILNEIDTQNAKLGTLKAVMGEAIKLLDLNQHIKAEEGNGYDRLKQNMLGVEKLRSRYEEQRLISKNINDEADILAQEECLADIRRTTIHVEQDIVKEQQHLDVIKSKIR